MTQYDAYEALPGLNLSGRQALGENLADVAGLHAAYMAYRKALGGKEAPVIDGLTGDQRSSSPTHRHGAKRNVKRRCVRRWSAMAIPRAATAQ